MRKAGIVTWCYSDGGRAGAGYKGRAGDCVVRAVSIATGLNYRVVYRLLLRAAQAERAGRRRRRNHPRTGMRRSTVARVLEQLGWRWQSLAPRPVAFRACALPTGRAILALSRHVCASIDGVIHDTHEPTGGGRRLLYGCWVPRHVPVPARASTPPVQLTLL